ncbi:MULTISPECIES: hypothetical protein [Pseudomonas]|uniref:Uncharacterized protein n=1 Tax=Pseudomonas auratipiscis TaxID=3115853 RepID=A0AB35WP24_9PSED|nr:MULTISPECIES: hypothetical protein [unclassified Pseudomonas]MEE1864954.1 hypothetical protein [Pseudomonas sp. 120P]MEE1956105.1 hypothetical protein [Pseudomonas sp. 119P]
MKRKAVLAVSVVVILCLLLLASVFLREWPVSKNLQYRMFTDVLPVQTYQGGYHSVENLETMVFAHGEFKYTSTWAVDGRMEYLHISGKVYPLWGDYGYMKVSARMATEGLVELLSHLNIPLALNRQLEFSEGSYSYVRLLKNSSSGMCFYHYDSNNVFCFGVK